MDAYPLLARIATLLERHGLQVVLIGNAAAALQGAPVTTLDFDFLFRPMPANKKKLTHLTAELEAVLLKPHYPVSSLMRISRDEDGLQLNFWGDFPGIKSFDDLIPRTVILTFGTADLRIAALPESAQPSVATPVRDKPSKQPRAACKPTRQARLDALKKEDDLAERALIRRLLALPIEKRTHFLRKRIGFRMSAL